MRTYKIVVALALGCAALCMTDHARADCFEDAARYQHVNPLVLRAIAWQESHGHPEAKHFNDNGSVDFGMMQINSVHLAALSRFGVSSGMLMNACVSVYVAAWHLKKMMVKYGNTWAAIGAYHSEAPRERQIYESQIRSIVQRLQAMGQRDRSGVAKPT
jgi:soluble lytic murein transglycosylase-like protein